MTDLQLQVLTVLSNGPSRPAAIAEEVWPDREFKSRQGAARALASTISILDKKGMTYINKHSSIVISSAGKDALQLGRSE